MSFLHRAWACLLTVAMTACLGCTAAEDPMMEMVESDLKKTKVDDLVRTMDYMTSEIRFNQREFKDKVAGGLDRWVSYSKDKLDRVEWSADELTKPLFANHPYLSMLERDGEYKFLTTDAYFIQEQTWLTEIVERVVAVDKLSTFEVFRLAADNFKADEDSEQPIVDLMQKLHPDLDELSVESLAKTIKVFDWVIRNIQLDEEFIVAEDDVEEQKLREGDSLASSGVRGLGYIHFPWQSLLYGHGDYIDRAKLFMLALRHLNLDSAMIAVKGETGEDQPWAVGVAIGDQYFMFDTRLGLPIMTEKIGTIATLKQIRSQPELISSLDLTTDESLEDDTQYWVRPEQLDELSALVYVTPESISRRMKALESLLVGKNRMQLSWSGDSISSRLPKLDNVTNKSWDIAFTTHEFRAAVAEALEQTSNNVISDKLRWHQINEAYVDNFVVYRTARARFFKGRFKTDPEATMRNAVESCQRLKYTDDEIGNLGSDSKLQERMGIRKVAEQSALAFLAQVQSVQFQMELVRRDAGLFLSQCLFDNGSPVGASKWLEVIQDEIEEEVSTKGEGETAGVRRWADGIAYLTGRCYEATKEYNRAIDAYSQDAKLAQAHGNLIRARYLKQLIAEL